MGRKVFVRLDRIRRDADHFSAGREIVVPTIAQRTHLARAHRRFVARIKKQHDDFAAMIGQAPGVAVSILQRKAGRRRVNSSFVTHHSISSARMLSASSTSSSVLKKCGDMRRPALGRESTNTLLSASRSTITGPSLTPIITDPPRLLFSRGVLMVQPRSDAKSIIS